MNSSAPTTSSFLLIFRDSSDIYKGMTPEQQQTLLQKWDAWYDRLAAEGKLIGGHPLQPEGRIVSGTSGGRVVDGPFAESKEAIGGYFFLTVADLEEATSIAKQCPSLALGLTVEVRPIAARCPVLSASPQPELAHA